MKEFVKSTPLVILMEQMPQEYLMAYLDKGNEQINNLPGIIVDQAAIAFVKTEYELVGIDMNKYQSDYILLIGAKMLGICIISMGAGIATIFLSAKVATKLGRLLREKIFEKVLGFSNSEFNKFSTASLITRNTNDVQQIQNMLAMLFRIVIYAPIIGVGGFLKVLMSSNEGKMTWIIGLAIFAVLLIVGVLLIVAMPKFQSLQRLIDKVNGVTREILTGLPVIRAFNREKHEEKRFDTANVNLTKTNLFVNRAMATMFPLMFLIMNSVTVLIIWVGGHNVSQGIMQVGDLLAFMQYALQIIMAFLMMSAMSIMLPRAIVSSGRIMEVIETESTIVDPDDAQIVGVDKDICPPGIVEFKNVGFKYPNAEEYTLEEISFTAKPGEITAIIGGTRKW